MLFTTVTEVNKLLTAEENIELVELLYSVCACNKRSVSPFIAGIHFVLCFVCWDVLLCFVLLKNK